MKPAVEITDLTKRYDRLCALDNVSFNVERGELFGLIGPDGAGKSSLYKILATLSQPDSGTATVCGLDTVREYKQLRTRIGYMPEKFSLYQDMTVSENLNFFASLFGVTVRESYNLIAPIFRYTVLRFCYSTNLRPGLTLCREANSGTCFPNYGEKG